LIQLNQVGVLFVIYFEPMIGEYQAIAGISFIRVILQNSFRVGMHTGIDGLKSKWAYI
jgi:hypothetical protein